MSLLSRIQEPLLSVFSEGNGHKDLECRESLKYPCENCKLRAHYDKNPKSFLSKFWRRHINFCPGFKAFFTHQDDAVKVVLREKYNFHKY